VERLIDQLAWTFVIDEGLEEFRRRHLMPEGADPASSAFDPRFAPTAEASTVVLVGDARKLRPVVERLGLPAAEIIGEPR
jgi:hypothetical protein